MKIIKETCYKGTRILLGNEKQAYLQKCRGYLKSINFMEIEIPIIQNQLIFENKIGENNNLMFTFQDRGFRNLCLAPEYTAIIQQLSKTVFKNKTNMQLFYISECFRGEKPQKGRYRQFTQLGVEVINPMKDFRSQMIDWSLDLCRLYSENLKFDLNGNATRGLDYYKNGKGFEISCEELGSSKQICGGGEYDGGIGFAIGVDRLLELKELKQTK